MFKENFVIKSLLVLMFISVAFFISPAAHVSANSSHNHETISPFNSQNHNHKIHCDLNKHQLFSFFCPHSDNSKNREITTIAFDCGGKTPESFPLHITYTGCDFSLTTSYRNPFLVLIGQQILFHSCPANFFLPFRIDRPPQNI